MTHINIPTNEEQDINRKIDYQHLAQHIKQWGHEFGFQQTAITDIDLKNHPAFLKQWLDNQFHGDMQWMETHQAQRTNPRLLVKNAMRVISVRMDYLPENSEQIRILKQADKAYISRYALGRDYHKLLRKRLAKLADNIHKYCEKNFAHDHSKPTQRPFVDSAPVLEKAFAEKAGLGWIGKHTVLINESAGSWFFLGELIIDLPLPIDNPTVTNRCGECTACLKICPTDAFIGPYQLDARRCIAYLTIEHKGVIPQEFREPMGNRVFGCDDCQLICPWNKFAKPTQEKDFSPRHQLQDSDLLTLFMWSETEYLQKTEGSALRRIGYERWLRNLAVGLGNAQSSPAIITALNERLAFPSPMVQEHIQWALERQQFPKRRLRKIKRNNT